MMSSAEEFCVECGVALAANVPKGLCSRCALKGALSLSDFEVDPEEEVSSAAPQPFESPRPFGDYELIEEIARGGMGVVYKARQKNLDRIVAIKMLLFGPMASQAVIRRFRVEAVAAGGLHHPNIVTIHEVGIHDGQHFLVMDYVDGPTLTTLLHNQPLPPRRAAELTRTIAEAIQYAHECGILHRDIKPSNILISQDETPRVTDFGLARRIEGDSSLTVSGHPLGSPSYMPPEQASPRQGKVSARSDVYSLGATLYHLLTGHPPFQGDSIAHTLGQVLHQEPVSPRLLNPRTPEDLETICLKCLQKDPNQRFSSARELADELDRFLKGEPIRSRAVSWIEKIWRFCKRKPAVASLATAATFLLLIVAIGSPITTWRIRKSQQRLAENLYAADMKLVQLALGEGNWGRARALLESYVPVPGTKDLRGFEWHYFTQLAKGDQLRTVMAHSSIASAIAFAPDRRIVVTASFDRSIKFWEYPALRFLSEISLSGERIVSMSVRADGQLVAATTDSFHAYLWQMNSGQLLTNIPGQWNYVAFAPSGPNLALSGGRIWGDGEGPLAVWDTSTQQAVRTWPEGGSRVEWSHDGKRLFSGPVKSGIAWHEIESGSTARLFDSEPRLLSLACSPNGKFLAVATVGTTQAASDIQLWDLEKNKTIAALHGHTANVWKIAFSPDSRVLASGSSDQSVRLWESDTGRLATVLRGHGDEVWSLAFTPDDKLLSADKQGAMLLWDLPRPHGPDLNSQIARIVGPRVFSPDGGTMAVGIGNQRVALIDLQSEQPRRIIENVDCAIGFEEEGHVLLALSSNGLRRIYLTEDKTSAPRQLDPPLANFEILSVSADHRFLAAENEPGQLSVWDLNLGRAIHKTTLPEGRRVTFLKFSPDNQQLAVVRERGEDVLLFSGGLKNLRTLKKHTLEAWSADFSSDSSLIATAAMDDRVVLWRIDTLDVVATFDGHKEGVSGVAFSPDNKTIAALCGNRSIKLWNVATRREVANLPFNQMSAYVEFSPDGRILIAYKPWQPEPRFEFWHTEK
jgi:WD40 repeat protein/tRNA A-37 threonylcarbamoyl transferase component Bud32